MAFVEEVQLTDAEKVALDKADLEVAETITKDLELPTLGENGSVITWASSNEAVIAVDGTVVRPAAGSEDAVVTLTATITNGEATDTATFTVTVKAEVAQTGESQLLATFTFGDNGATGHDDGDDIGTAKTYSNNGYDLALTSVSKCYDGAKDETGVSALKLGTSKVAGTFTFTVGEDVNKVIIYVSGYKAKTVSITINGTEQSITTTSNSGTYTAVTIDTTTTKTITFATTTNYRAMIDAIEYHS